MNRRDAISALLGTGVALLAPCIRAQVSRVHRIGFLSTLRLTQFGTNDAFHRSLRELGYAPGKDLIVEARFADGDYARLPAYASELAQKNLELIVALGSSAIDAARKAMPATPIVMTAASDPLASGFVKNLAHPGGNITGVANFDSELSAKLVDLLATTMPHLGRFALLANPASPAQGPITAHVQAAARNARIAVVVVEAKVAADIKDVFDTLAREKVNALIVSPSSLFYSERKQIAQLALTRRMPTVFGFGGAVPMGGMIDYQADFGEHMRRAASYVDKILKGARPADLPIEQPTQFVLSINMMTAKALGVSIPDSILLRASSIVE